MDWFEIDKMINLKWKSSSKKKYFWNEKYFNTVMCLLVICINMLVLWLDIYQSI